MTRLPPSLLPGSDGTRWPAFYRYYEAATTTGLFSRRSVYGVAPRYLGLIPSFRSLARGNRLANARVLLNRSHPLAPVFGPRTPSVLPSSLRTPRAFALLSDSGRASTPGLTACRCCPRTLRGRGPPQYDYFRSSITRLLHWLFTLRAALSDDDAKLASGGLPNLSGWAFSYPLSSFGEFRLSLPLSQGFHGAT